MTTKTPQVLQDVLDRLQPRDHAAAHNCYSKAVWLAQRVDVGEELHVTFDKHRSVKGNILAARVHRLRVLGRSIQAVFEVDLECGVNKVVRQVHVRAIPTTR